MKSQELCGLPRSRSNSTALLLFKVLRNKKRIQNQGKVLILKKIIQNQGMYESIREGEHITRGLLKFADILQGLGSEFQLTATNHYLMSPILSKNVQIPY